MKRLESVVNRMTSIAQLRNYSVLVVLFSFLTVLNLRAQTVVSTCSDDTIKLIAENYQYGALEWEKSVDSITWTRIENAHGTEYVFVPDESAYYRAVNKFSYCNPQYSTVFVVEKLPAAHAGSNRIVNATFVYLSGNFSRNSSCSWTVLEGSGGVFEQPNQPATKFTGVPADGTPDGPTGFYRLCYTLENSCGISRDTIEVNFVYNQYYDKLVIVDETDTIMSDSTQLVNGEYSIRFANPVPTIDDQTILIGISGDGFMQKVSSVSQSGNYFVMKTSQAKLEEILTKGGLELGQLYNFDPINETYRVKGYKRLNKVPTRAELLTEEKFKTGSHFFIVDEHMETDLDGVTISKVKRNDKIQRIKNENYDSQNNEDEFIAYSFDNTTLYDKNGIKANLDGVLEFVPNIVSDIKVNWLDFEDTNVNIGVDNAKVSFKSKLTVTSSGSYNSELDQITLGTVHKKMIVVVGGVPTLLQIKTQLKLATAFSATGNVTYVNEYEKTYKVSAGVKYEDNEWTNYFSENESSSMKHDLQVKGTLAPSFELGPIIYFTINGIAGPYVDTRLTTDLTLCASTQNLNDFNWQAEAMLGARLTLGIHGYMFKKKLFDFSKTWENRKLFHEVYPYTMEYVSGNNQQFSSTNSTLEQPFKVRVLSKLGVPAVGILVSFVPENNSGTLSNYQVFTDSEGYAQTYFTPAEPTVCKVKAYAKDCSFSNLHYSPVLFIASGFDCSKSTLSAHFLKKDNLITLVGTTGTAPYSYSIDGTNFSSTPPVIAVEAGKEYLAFVKDAKGCLALAYYKEREPGCDESTLQLNVEQSGRNVKAVASGGKAPYVYALNDQGYSAVSEFLNLANGTYAVKVKDGQGCERQVTITISISSTSLNNGLVAYYPFDGNAKDESGNGHNGTIQGSIVLTTDRFGEQNKAYKFPGIAFNYIQVPNAPSLQLSVFTLNAWIYTDTDYGSGQVIQKGRDIINGHYGLYTTIVGATNLYSGVNSTSAIAQPSIGVWHMITGSVNGKNAKFYLDGKFMKDTTLTNPFVCSGTEPLVIGMHYYKGVPSYWTYPYKGKIDDISIYNRILSDAEISTLYNLTQTTNFGIKDVEVNGE